MLVSSVPPGTRYANGSVIMIQEEVGNDIDVQHDRRTAEVVRAMASDIFDGICFTADCPSSNNSGKMPVLDLQLWLEKGESGTNRIRFEYYEKPMTSKVVIHRESAMPWNIKRSTLVSEAVSYTHLTLPTKA